MVLYVIFTIIIITLPHSSSFRKSSLSTRTCHFNHQTNFLAKTKMKLSRIFNKITRFIHLSNAQLLTVFQPSGSRKETILVPSPGRGPASLAIFLLALGWLSSRRYTSLVPITIFSLHLIIKGNTHKTVKGNINSSKQSTPTPMHMHYPLCTQPRCS